jgi:competence protein ComEC
MFYQEKPVYRNGQLLILEVVLQEEPELSNKGQKFAVTDAYNQTLYITYEAFPRLHFGQVLQIEGELQEIKLEDGRILYSMYHPDVAVRADSMGFIPGLASAIRNQSKIVFESTLPPVSASLLMGIVFGAKEHFPDDFFNALQTTGVLHVIAASGMNVTFIAAALLFTLSRFMRRQLALVIGCFGILFYVFLVGFEPSIIRASIMAVLAFSASLFGRQHIAAFAVLVSAYTMLLYQPGFLFDIGFQLSFFATLGILFIKPLLPLPQNFFAETISTTIAAQLGTLPILLGVFGEVGLLSLLVNALVLWTVPFVMLLGSLAVVCNFVFMPLAQMLLFASLPLLSFFEYVVMLFGRSDWILHIPPLPKVFWLGYYCVAAAFILTKKPDLRAEERKLLFSDL